MRGTEGRDRPDLHPHPRGCGFPRPLPARSSRRATSAPPSVANDSPSPAPRIPPSLQHGRGAAGLGGAFPCRQSRLLLRQPRKFVPAAPVPPPAGWRFLCSFFLPLSLPLSLPYPLPPSTNCPISVTFLRFFSRLYSRGRGRLGGTTCRAEPGRAAPGPGGWRRGGPGFRWAPATQENNKKIMFFNLSLDISYQQQGALCCSVLSEVIHTSGKLT